MVEADREAWTQIGTRALTAGEKFRVERMVGKWAREHRWGACMGRAVAILFAGFALFYFGPTYSWWGAGLFLLLALIPLLVASTSAEAARSAPAANVVIDPRALSYRSATGREDDGVPALGRSFCRPRRASVASALARGSRAGGRALSDG